MAWISLKGENSRMQLTDGYLVGDVRATPRASADKSPEQNLASYLHDRAKRYTMRFKRNFQEQPEIDVWVVGSSGWLQRTLPEPFDSIAEGETDDNYRIVIINEQSCGQGYVNGWIDWLYSAGMPRKKRHTDLYSFRGGGRRVLEEVRDSIHTDQLSTRSVLALYDLPLVHVGALPDGQKLIR